jgi:chromosome partitioning protein
MTILTISNQKGGVGKTTLSFNLIKALAAQGRKVLAIDNDPQANLTSALLADQHPIADVNNICALYKNDAPFEPLCLTENLHLLGTNKHLAEMSENAFEVVFKFKKNVNSLKQAYDLIVIDTLPSFGLLQMAPLVVSDYVLVPSHCDKFSLDGIAELFDKIDVIQENMNHQLQVLGIVINEVSGAKTKVDTYFKDILQTRYKQLVMPVTLSKSVKIKESIALYQSIFEYAPQCKQADEYQRLVECLLSHLEGQA